MRKLEPILVERGYGDADIDNIFHANWCPFFRRWLPESSAA